MTFGLVDVSDSLPKGQAVKLIFFAPCIFVIGRHFHRDAVTGIGDLNLNRLRPQRKEGKLLLDLEMKQCFECMIKQPTRLDRKGTTTTSTLTDLLLTNRPDLFIRGRVFDPALSDHRLIYGIMWEKAKKHSRKIIYFRSYTNFDPVKKRKSPNCGTLACWKPIWWCRRPEGEASKRQRHNLHEESMEKRNPSKEKGNGNKNGNLLLNVQYNKGDYCIFKSTMAQEWSCTSHKDRLFVWNKGK